MRYRFTLLAVLTAFSLHAQMSEGGLPTSFLPDFQAVIAGKSIEPVVLPKLDVAQAWAEDSRTPGQNRFAAPISADISMENAGAWADLPDGGRLWRCGIKAADALGLALLFDQFKLPPGAQFFVYSADKQWLRGAFTEQSILPSGKFLVGVVPGETAWLEYREPAAVRGQSKIHINRVDYAYDRNAMVDAQVAGITGFGTAEPCHLNINCPQGATWQTEKRGINRILMVFSNGLGWCSGTTIANTSGTPEPYVLSANHCQLIGENPDFDLWRFDFGYESADCNNPTTEPIEKSVLGCERVAFRNETDFMLLRMTALPTNFNVYFNGWNRNASPGLTGSTFIHHPVGDLKKISVDQQAATVFPQQINWGGIFGVSPSNSHWIVVPDEGYFQPGSSGSPLFNPAKLIVGQLHGGNATPANCTVQNTYWGRFDLSWNQGATAASRLRDWLDPTNTGATTQNGYIPPAPTQFTVSGNVQTHWGQPMSNLTVHLTGSVNSTTQTDASGNYTFANLPAGSNLTITPVRDIEDANGVTSFDLVLISKHILGLDPFDSPWKIIAVDANKNNLVTTFDIVEIRKMILGLYPGFPDNTSWRFFPAGTTFPDPANPFINPLPAGSITVTNLQANFTGGNFLGVKIGDANNGANPGE
jgi:lysyl endopeptidase